MSQNNNTTKQQFYKVVEENGETKQEEIYFQTKRQWKFKENYMVMFQGGFMEKQLAVGNIGKGLSKSTEVLFFLMLNMETKNEIRLMQKEIAEKLKMDRFQLNKILKKLESMGFIKIHVGRIELADQFVYKGRVRDHQQAK